MTDPLRIAVIGAGMFGRRHIETLAAEPDCTPVAIADPTADAAAFAAARGLAHFAGHEALLDAVRPDGVIIAAPNALHAPIGIACARRRIPMLVEKPVAETVEAAADLVAAAAASGTPMLVGHHRRYNPIVEKARALVREGAIGRVTAVTGLWLVKKPDPYFEVAWRRQPGGGPILINLIHDIDMLRFIVGEIAAVTAFTASAARGFPVEDSAAIALRFAGGAIGTITVSDAVGAPWNWELTSREYAMYSPADENCLLIAGTGGALTVPKLELWRYPGTAGWTSPLARESIGTAAADPQARQIAHFCRVIRGLEAPRIDGADGARTLAATLAVKQAAESGMPVVLQN
jgi:predicted dehydrogenase